LGTDLGGGKGQRDFDTADVFGNSQDGGREGEKACQNLNPGVTDKKGGTLQREGGVAEIVG